MADALYAKAETPYVDDAAPAEVKAMRAADSDRRMYGAQGQYAALIPDDVPDLDARAAREVAADLGASPAEIGEFVGVLRQQHATPATDEQRAAWRAEAVEDIKARGITHADLDAARALVARDPRVAELLDRTGLGNRADVIRAFVQLARKQRLR